MTGSALSRSMGLALAVVIATLTLTSTSAQGSGSREHPDAGVEYLLKTPRIQVYVYDAPIFNNSDLIDCYRSTNGIVPWLHEDWDVAENLGELWLHRALLDHPWRVFDPEDADVFFVPMYPFLSFHLLVRTKKNSCPEKSHWRRMGASLYYLARKSPYFKRFGGADHIVMCTWWKCRVAFGTWHRMLLRRVILGVYEFVDYWFDWGCLGREVTAPYVANSAITRPETIGGAVADADRTIPFFFVGTDRERPERTNLKVVKRLSPASMIELSPDEYTWTRGSDSYAKYISRSRFCFCPRGDTLSSRRLFDAIAAGCIPVLTEDVLGVLPFQRTGLDYWDFMVVVPVGAFLSERKLARLVHKLSIMPRDQVLSLQKGLVSARATLIYGVTSGPEWGDMRPSPDTAARFLTKASLPVMDHKWDCPSQQYDERDPELLRWAHPSYPCNKTWADFPPPAESRSEWLRESETIVLEENKLLFCAPKNTGALQFRMLAKRIKGVGHWAVSDNSTLLFDAAVSELPLLDTSNATLMTAIYKDINSGWITLGVVRDPATRLLSLYFDMIRSTQRAGQNAADWSGRARQRNSKWGFTSQSEWGGKGDEWTFAELVETLTNNVSLAPPAFQPMSRTCGMGESPFDTIIPFETLKETSTQVLQSLPRSVWQEYGAEGWGPRGHHSFMEYDYGSVSEQENVRSPSKSVLVGQGIDSDVSRNASWAPRRARDMFGSASCMWTDYYVDEETLLKVWDIYREDYDMFAWYSIDDWIRRLRECRNTNALQGSVP